ncbi:MAG: dockerin type I domain-containing protein, partial [Luteolibacter sp.]
LVFSDNGDTANGELVITGSDGTLEAGSGKLLTLDFKVASTITLGDTLGVGITSATLQDTEGNPLTVEFLTLDEPEAGDSYIEGDLTGDGTVTTADKDLLQDLIKPKARAATADELAAGDLSGDGKLDQKDWMLLIQLLNGP